MEKSELVELIQKRFEEGWNVDSLKNICNSHEILPFDVACFGSMKLIKALGILEVAYNIKKTNWQDTEIAHVRRVLRNKFGLVFDI